MNCAASHAQLQTQAAASSSSKDAGIVAGWSSPSGAGIGCIEGEPRPANGGAQLVLIASPTGVLEPEVKDEERSPADSDFQSGYSEVAGRFVDVGVDIQPLKDRASNPPLASVNGASFTDVDNGGRSTNELNLKEIDVDGVPNKKVPRINGDATEGPNDVRQLIFERSSLSHYLPASSISQSSMVEEENPESDGGCTDQNVREKLDVLIRADDVFNASAQREETEGSLPPFHGELDDRVDGSCTLSDTMVEEKRNQVGIGLLDGDFRQAQAEQNGSLVSTSEPTSLSSSGRLSKSLKWRRRKQRKASSLEELWEEFLRVHHGSSAEVLDLERYETLYQRLLSADRIKDSLEVLESMEKLGFLDMSKIYHAKFFNACKRHQAVEEAFRFMKLIKDPLLSTFNQLLGVCARAKDLEGAFEVFSSLEKAGLKADCILYTTLISACAKAGKVDLIFQVFHEMVKVGVEPNIHTYGALIDGCARAGQVGKAFGVYGIMRSKNLKPDQVIFNSLITACGRSGALERAFDVLSEMKAEPISLQPNHVTIGALIRACTQGGQVNRALEVYKMMHDKGIQGSAEVYTEAVHSCSRNGDLDAALAIYQDMKNRLVQPDEVFFSALIDVAGHAGQVDACFQVLEDMKKMGLEPGVTVYSAIMGACSNSGSWEKGLATYREMLEAGLSPTVSTVNALVTALSGAGKLKEAIQILQEMRRAGVVPNYITYTVLLEASEKAGDIDLAFDLYKKAISEGIIPTMEMCDSILGLCLHQIWKLSSGPTPTASVSSSVGLSFCEKCSSWALSVYRETMALGAIPTIKIFSRLLGCLRLPRTAEGFHYSSGMSRQGGHKQPSLIDGFGVYDPRALALFEEAALLGVVPSFSYIEGPITINTVPMPVFIAEVCLLTLLKGFKHRHAAGARLLPITILLAVEERELMTPTNGKRKVMVISRTSQAVVALLRRLGLNFHGHESSGKLKITSAAIRHWLRPNPAKQVQNLTMWQLDSGPQHSSLGKKIAEQQRMMRYEESPSWSLHPLNKQSVQPNSFTNNAEY